MIAGVGLIAFPFFVWGTVGVDALIAFLNDAFQKQEPIGPWVLWLVYAPPLVGYMLIISSALVANRNWKRGWRKRRRTVLDALDR